MFCQARRLQNRAEEEFHCGGLRFAAAAASNLDGLQPSLCKWWLELNNAYNTSGLGGLDVPESVEHPVPGVLVHLGAAEVQRWRHALNVLRDYLRPEPAFVLYIQSLYACEATEGGVERLWMGSVIYADVLALHRLACERGGVQSFYTWTAANLQLLMKRLGRLRYELKLAMREMLVCEARRVPECGGALFLFH